MGLSDGSRSLSALREVAARTSATLGNDYLRALVEHLTAAVGVRYGLIGTLVDRETVQTVAVWNGTGIGENFVYRLEGTPCANVVDRETRLYREKVQELFPKDAVLAEMGAESYLGTPLFDSDGRALGVLVLMDDRQLPEERVTLALSLLEIFAGRAAAELERQEVEDALRDSERRYRSLFENSRDAIVIFSRDGKIENVNPAAVKLFGFSSKEELLQVHAGDLYKDAADRERFFTLLDENGSVEDHENVFRTKNGREILAMETGRAVHDKDGRVVGYRGLLRDVTRQRALEHHLRLSQKADAVGKLAGGVAHDFNNLLTAIRGYTELCLAEAEAPSPFRQNLLEIQKAGERAATLTRHLLAFSRQQVMRTKVLDLSRFVAAREDLLRSAAGESVKLELHLEPSPWYVKADPAQLEQLLLTLLDNAREAGAGQIVVETGNAESDCDGDANAEEGEEMEGDPSPQAGPCAFLTVADDGCGMDAETLGQVFEPFFTTREEGHGTGLGLASVYGIVQQSGGDITIDSEPGTGTTVRVYLPRVREKLAATEPRPYQPPSVSGTILLAEDNKMVRSLVTQVLERVGYRVLVAAEPRQALQIAAGHKDPIDLLLTDLVMPVMNGLDLAARVLEKHPTASVLVMSGYSKKTGFDTNPLASRVAFLQKPFTPEALERKVAQVLGGDRLSKATG